MSNNDPNSPIQSKSDPAEHTTLSTNIEKKRYIRIEDIERGKLTDDELIKLFEILHSYNPIEYAERNIWKINHYTKFPTAYSECLDNDCYPEDFEHGQISNTLTLEVLKQNYSFGEPFIVENGNTMYLMMIQNTIKKT